MKLTRPFAAARLAPGLGAALLALSCLVPAPASAATRISDKLVHYKLANGLTVFIYPRPQAPLFTGMIYVDAGSAEENVGETGLAHMLEHMAFKGTPYIGTRDWNAERAILAKIDAAGEALNNARQQLPPDEKLIEARQKALADLERQASAVVVPNEYDKIITREGGQETNATTDVDYTNYFITIPANKLEMWAMMESERLTMPSWREFYKERDVVAEERRMRTEDTPMGKIYEEFMAAAFRAHAYRNPTIGWMTDIQNLTMARIDRFYKAWYVPENIVIVLVGDVKADEAKPILEKYFGTIPARPTPQRSITVEPPQRGERRIQVTFDAQPQLLMGWKKPTFPDPDMAVFEVIQFLMRNNGRSSRLYERLVKKDELCQDASAFTGPGDKYPGMFMVYAIPRAPHTAAEAEKAILDEMERLKREPVPADELERTRNQVEAAFLGKLDTNLGLAREQGYYYIASKDPNVLDHMRERMLATTPADIQRVARRYFTRENRTVAELLTKTDDETTTGGGTVTAGGPQQPASAVTGPGSPQSDPAAKDPTTTATISPDHDSAATGPAGDAKVGTTK